MAEPLGWETALVTGASSGIGEAVVREVVRRGVGRIVLVARRVDRLEELAREVAGTGAQVEVLAADLADRSERQRVEERLARDEHPVDLLVNNAGFGTSGRFADLDPAEEERQVLVNVVAPQQLARAVLPGMLRRGRGAVVNVASMATLIPLPKMATYAATKAFVTSFSEALHEETRGTGVTVSAALPGFTRTEFVDRLGDDDTTDGLPGFVWLSADDVAASIVEGARQGQALIVPGLGYRVTAAAVAPLPRTLRRRMVGLVQSVRG